MTKRYAVTVGYRRKAQKDVPGWHGRATVYVKAKSKQAAMDKAEADAQALHRDIYDVCAFDATEYCTYAAA